MVGFLESGLCLLVLFGLGDGKYGDWRRDLAIFLGRGECGLKLAELGELCGVLDYRTVGTAVTKAIARIGKHREFQKAHTSAQKRLAVN